MTIKLYQCTGYKSPLFAQLRLFLPKRKSNLINPFKDYTKVINNLLKDVKQNLRLNNFKFRN